jgi:hypothetical protein
MAIIMKSKQIRLSVDVLEALEKKLIAEGKPAHMAKSHIAVYVTEALWSYLGGSAAESAEPGGAWKIRERKPKPHGKNQGGS